MTTTDPLADDAAVEPDDSGAEEGPPYERLDAETASKCGLWLE